MSITVTIGQFGVGIVVVGAVSAVAAIRSGRSMMERSQVYLTGLALAGSWVACFACLYYCINNAFGLDKGLLVGAGCVVWGIANTAASYIWGMFFAITHFGYGK